MKSLHLLYHFLIAILLFAGCASSPEPASTASDDSSFESRVERLRLGMTKQQIIAIMGDNYRPGGKTRSTHGSHETMAYLPSFGSRYATALKRNYSFGIAGRHDANAVTLHLQNGRLSNIAQF